jgi:hemoglobin-like flavoprotein
MLTTEQIALVKGSWSKVVPIADTAAGLFYGRLFEMDPSLRSMFKGDMKVQGEKLMKMITVAVDNLERLDEIVPAVQELGVRHLEYGVKNSQYDTVGAALLWTLGQGLGDAFTDDVRKAWTDVYMLLAGTMKEAATAAA